MLLYVATSNPGKLRDFSTAAEEVAGSAIVIEPLPGLAEIPTPPEDEPTFEGNAIAKARYYSNYAQGGIVIADDSGLEVDALDKAPGVRSARYAEDAGFGHEELPLDERNNLLLLRSLEGVDEAARTARYRCSLAAACDGELLATADGIVEGSILTAPLGDSGFGYDPLFFLPEQGKSMAEIDPVTRLKLSHRGRALRALLRKLPATNSD